MYLYRTLASIYKKTTREALFGLSEKISRVNNKNRLLIMFDMVRSSLVYGALFTEYNDLDFIKRNNANRKTFITTYYNFKLYDKINAPKYRDIFHNKIQFLCEFGQFTKRKWVDIKSCDERAIEGLILDKDKIVLKNSYGDSGKQVCIYKLSEDDTPEGIISYMRRNGYDLAEEVLTNHKKLAYFNPTSLNTVRIVTVNRDNNVSFLFAGLRIGAKGSELDNISQGGSVARVDLETGRINTHFYGKKSERTLNTIENKNDIGYELPCWTALKNMAENAARIIPEMGIVAWDICITPKGPVIVEGNESFGSTILQVFVTPDEEGLKPQLEKILKG